MPVIEITKRMKLIAAATGVSALVSTALAVAMFSGDDYSREINGTLGDAGVSRTSGAVRVTDLLTEIVEPGESVITGVTLPRGWRVTDIVPSGSFTIEKQDHVDRDDVTWYEVTAHNGGIAPMRFVAFVEFAQPMLGDGGL